MTASGSAGRGTTCRTTTPPASSALQFNENAVRVTVGPGTSVGDWAGVAIAPAGSGLSFGQSLHDVGGRRGAKHRGASAARQRAAPAARHGAAWRGAGDATGVRRQPDAVFVNALRTALIAHGIDVRGPAVDIDDIRDAPARPDGAPLISHRSPPLSTLAIRLMKVSQNLYAETLLKTLAAGPATATTAAGRSIAQTALQAWGIGPDGLIQRDGSGLSRYDYVTPEALVTILAHVDREPSLHGPFEARCRSPAATARCRTG